MSQGTGEQVTASSVSYQTVIVSAQPGFYKRAAACVVKIAQRFQADILLSAGAETVNAKSSLIALMFLGAFQGQALVLSAQGHDALQAVQALSKIFRNNAAGVCGQDERPRSDLSRRVSSRKSSPPPVAA